jgi:RNA polymerase sigma-70 factor, ECF subfamily
MRQLRIEKYPKDPAPRGRFTAAGGSVRSADRDAPLTTRTADDRALVARTLAGDPAAFGEVVDRNHAAFLRLARAWVHDETAAKAIVNNSWLAILDGLATFQFDCSFRTWMMRVVACHARRWSEEVPTSRGSACGHDADDGGTERFDADGTWVDPPTPWDGVLVDEVVATVAEKAISDLPSDERAVLTLRDVEGFAAEDACDILDLGMSRQRALLHRARERIRRALEQRCRESANRPLASTG